MSHSIKDGGKNTKEKPANDPSQQGLHPTLVGKISMIEKTPSYLNHAKQVCRAKIYQALHVARSNYSFAPTQGDSKRFRSMFPNLPMALVYAETDAKITYNLQFDIAPHSKEQLIYDFIRCPFPSSSMRAPID